MRAKGLKPASRCIRCDDATEPGSVIRSGTHAKEGEIISRCRCKLCGTGWKRVDVVDQTDD